MSATRQPLAGKRALVTGSTAGLGEAIAGSLARAGTPMTFRSIALADGFLDAGALPTLHDRYGISAAAIAESVRRWL